LTSGGPNLRLGRASSDFLARHERWRWIYSYAGQPPRDGKLARKEHLGDPMIIDETVVETDSAWYFPYGATAFTLHRNISAALAGNLPARVLKDGASVTFALPPS
jgi:hypothetical protein